VKWTHALPAWLLFLVSAVVAQAQGRIGPVSNRPGISAPGSSQISFHHRHHHFVQFASAFSIHNSVGYGVWGLPLPRGAVIYYSPWLYPLPAPLVLVGGGVPASYYNDGQVGGFVTSPPRSELLPPPVPVRPKVIDVPPGELRPPRPEPLPLPGAAGPAIDPKIEADRQMQLGKDAMQNWEYARAERRFEAATRASPEEPLAHFLLAVARFSLGKYQEAVSAIQAGMRLRPDWPTVAFSPREVYGTNHLEFPRHLRRLADALARHPEDPLLPFLYAYHLWFDDRRDDARPIFARAKVVASDPIFSEPFLRIK